MLVRPPFYVGDIGYPIDFAGAFDGAAYLARTPSIAGDLKKWSFSTWIMRSELSATAGILVAGPDTNNHIQLRFDTSDRILLAAQTGGTTRFNLTTSQVFRDIGSVFHLLVHYDSDNAVASDRVKFFINGVRVTDFDTASYPALGHESLMNTAITHNIGRLSYTGAGNDAALHTQTVFMGGLLLAAEDVGAFNINVPDYFVPVDVTGLDYSGTNSFLLDFADDLNLGKDVSGQGNHWTNSGVTQTISTPTGVACTLNPLAVNLVNKPGTFSNNNNTLLTSAVVSGDYSPTYGTLGVSSGQWYWEQKIVGGTAQGMFGIGELSEDIPIAPGESPLSYGYSGLDGETRNDSNRIAYGIPYGLNDVIGTLLDLDAGTLAFTVNGVSQGIAYSGIVSGSYTPFVSDLSSGSSLTVDMHITEDTWEYTPPAGYMQVSIANIPEPDNKDVSQHWASMPYIGNGVAVGSGGNAVTGIGFQPDFVWLKSRTVARSHMIFDTIRGATKYLHTNATNAEATDTETLSSFDTDGFSLGGNVIANESGQDYIAWCAKLSNIVTSSWAGSPTITPSEERYNAKLGMSVIKYIGNGVGGATVPHSLGTKPGMLIVKSTTTATSWIVYLDSLGATKFLLLDTSDVAVTSSAPWNNVEPTPELITLGTSASTNVNGEEYVVYVFAESDFIKIGSYLGNADIDGPYINEMLSPAFMITRNTADIKSWKMRDSARSIYNPAVNVLYADIPNFEVDALGIGNNADLTSTGIKLRTSSGSDNGPSQLMSYIMIGTNTKYSNAR